MFFKYMEKEFALGLVNKGIVKIGTLYDFKNQEDYGSEIGDRDEGMRKDYERNVIAKITKSGIESNSDYFNTLYGSGPMKNKFIVGGDNAHISLNGTTVTTRTVDKDHYIFCGTYEPSYYSMRKMSQSYDTAILISDVKKFGKIIEKLLPRGSKFLDCYYCDYIERNEHHSIKRPSGMLIKDPIYAHQKEIRFIWEAPNDEIKPIILECKKLARLCSITKLN